MPLRPELGRVVRALLDASREGGVVDLDAVGLALGTLAVSTEDIELVFVHLEAEGRTVVAPSGGAERALKRVVPALHRLKRLGRRPLLAEVASEAELSPDQVLAALGLLRVMQR